MTILPAGNPLWLRNPGITQYGGDVNKRDYGGIGVINSQTDIGAAQYSRLTADLAAVARVTPLMRIVFITSAGAPSTTVQWCQPAWAVGVSYADGSAPPSASYPTIAGLGTSRIISLGTSAVDDFGVQATISAKIVMAIGGTWDGTIVGNLFSLSGITDGVPVSVTIW